MAITAGDTVLTFSKFQAFWTEFAASYNKKLTASGIKNDDATEDEGYVLDARMGKILGTEIDELSMGTFLSLYSLVTKTTTITTNSDGNKVITETSDAVKVVTTVAGSGDEKTITQVVTPTDGAYKYTKVTKIASSNGTVTITESYTKEEK